MDKQLEANAAALLALDERRTPGEWSADGDYMHKQRPVRIGTKAPHTPSATIAECFDNWRNAVAREPQISIIGAERNAAFIAAAPRMAALIRNLLAALREAEKVGRDSDAELLQFKRDLLRRKLAATSPKAQEFFWKIWAHAPCKAQTVDDLPEKVLMDSLRLCDRTLKATDAALTEAKP